MVDAGILTPEAATLRPHPVLAEPDLLRPSEYTALLLHALSMRADRIRGASVMEVGVGSGVVLAAAAQLGAARLTGVDIEPSAIKRTLALLADMPDAPPHDVVQGDMWTPFDGQLFDVIVTNLPHFPAPYISQPTRLNSWSNGGSDGRLRLDEFLGGLSARLTRDGIGLVVHSAFADLDLSGAQLAAQGLQMQPLLTTLIQVEPGKLRAMSPATRARFTGAELKQFGAYVFSLTHVMEITRIAPPVAATAS